MKRFMSRSVSLSLLTLALAFIAATPSSAFAAWSCQALYDVQQKPLPDWYKQEIKEQAEGFFQQVDGMNASSELAYTSTNAEMVEMSKFARMKLGEKNDLKEYYIETAVELAEILQEKKLLFSRNWYLNPANDTVTIPELGIENMDRKQFIKDKINPVMREMLEQKAKKFGFNDPFVVISSSSGNDFFGVIGSGKLFWDHVFLDGSHGADTHTTQVLYLAPYVEQKFGAGKLKEFYMWMGTPDGKFSWDRIFDGTDGSPSHPERLGPILRWVLPGR